MGDSSYLKMLSTVIASFVSCMAITREEIKDVSMISTSFTGTDFLTMVMVLTFLEIVYKNHLAKNFERPLFVHFPVEHVGRH